MRLSLLLLLTLLALPGLAADWQATLQNGSRISVDPDTNRAVVTSPRGGGPRPLWDGIHRLADGSTITVRSGLMVPNVPVLELRQGVPPEPPPATPPAEDYPCEELVDLACGPGRACADAESCKLAEQLRSGARDTSILSAGDRSWFLAQCRQALGDAELFSPCTKPVGGPQTACLRLSRRVCGPDGACAEQDDCRVARQLMEIERQERHLRLRPAKQSPTHECRKLLQEAGVRPPCGE